ncbi:TPA: hypothetical protein ACK1LG_004917 [Klebsiella pneumoniae]|uniref:hypothetical protein n=1 Tax=Klebsiella pneumoniae complex TaxID=3390273 RepID=UPI001D0E8A9B|nr:hypothetical protein [Klebsiella pneumoniae]MCQ0520516.1 hypothetical protein [Klebsiella pneumoniae]
MRQERALRIKAFRQALENAARMQPAKLRDESRWCELRQFPGGSCDLASNGLAQYLMESEGCDPCIIFMHGNGDFHIAENSTVHAHVIVLLDGEYIDLTLDQFAEYPEYISAESVESGGPLGMLLRNIMKHEGPVKTRKVNLDDMETIYAWLRDSADYILAADREWQALEQSVAEAREMAEKLFPFLSDTQITESEQIQADTATHVSAQKNRQPMTHVGVITECYRPREVRLRETGTQWVSECGLRFRKSTGAAVGSGVWSANRLDLKSIREIETED